MTVRELIEKLRELDQDKIIGIFGYKIECISENEDVNGDKFYSIG